ncbi:uncharacterized protein LOC120079795 isoform X2 [Benincasa hispida]|uniref:uncharacterized protein LOC120079795 isoform X2 n=1 Tax=Benincasa hispida TaxID=102211 RepID=UPI0018FF9382|nr:uncharacterized protein LOC120079795 isoform X2 [Benincasa hispida]
MDLAPFRLDIDELINEFAESGFTSFVDMKKVWVGRKFTYIFEAAPSTNLAFFMQSIYAQSISHMLSTASLSHRLGGLYCLYCLYETQPFKPSYKIYLSIGELKKLKELVVDAKENNVKVASSVVKRMLEKNMFLFGSVDMKESAALETVNQLTELQNARIQVAYNKLFNDTPIENYIHMDLGMEVGSNVLKKMSTDYSEAKKLALYASEIVDVHDIKHIAEDEKLIGDTVEKIAEDWNIQRGFFHEQTGLDQQLVPVEAEQLLLEGHADENFDQELERMLTDV